MLGIEVQGRVIKGGDIGSVDGTTIGDGTGYGRAMKSLHGKNRLRRSVIESSWVLQVTPSSCKDVHGMDDDFLWGDRRLC